MKNFHLQCFKYLEESAPPRPEIMSREIFVGQLDVRSTWTVWLFQLRKVNISESSISGFSSLLFEPILRYAGFFWTKLAMSVMTTGGAVLLAFYADNNDLIIWAWNLMGFPSVMYIILNINEQAPRFPSISGLTIGMIQISCSDSPSSLVLIGW